MLVAGGDPGFEYIRELVHRLSAVVLQAGQAYLVESRLMPLAEEHGFQSVAELVDRLRSEPFGMLHRRVVEAMTTNETSFFRDARFFDLLRDTVLPAVEARRRTERTLRIWSAACSTGQEPYSVAMVLRDSFPHLARWKVELFGTDLAADVLRRARTGIYSQLEVSRGLPAALLVKHFTKQGLEWHLHDDVRAMVAFHELNLIEPWPATMHGMDVVLLRNVLIYFDVETKRRILAKVRSVLRPDGYLLLGAAETTFMLDDGFERAEFDAAGCYRLRGGTAAR
jgi:chemotaxis protein methyltransferase CheR